MALVLLVVLGGGFVWPGWFKGDDAAGAKAVAEQLVTVVNNKDLDGARKIACHPGLTDRYMDVLNQATMHATFHVSLAGDPTVNGASATAPYKVSVHGSIRGRTVDKSGWDWTGSLANLNGTWCIDGFVPAR